jgi:hypothetical protein
MLSHSIELLFSNQCLELLRMVGQHGETLVQRNIAGISPDLSIIHTKGSHAGLLFGTKEPRRAKDTPPDQHSIDPSFSNPYRDVVKTLNVPIPQ